MSDDSKKIQLNLSEDDDGIDRSEIFGGRLRELAQKALEASLFHPGPHETPLQALEEVDIVLVSDEPIARIHGEFMDDPTPTDVITFHHGEILVSTDTATTVSTEFGHSAGRETLLYIIHGFLHLNGHHDAETTEHAEMHRIQDEILETILPASERFAI